MARLADAFSREGLRLPHLAGTVTNLDGAEVARSLASLRAELVRRQALLAGAKRTTGDATMDVSSYQRHFAAGELSEPMPHLFVVADEFAELKAQEPEFMDGLVSAARIGRSLGVHLVLATQKPTGVVSDQIQANSRFRVCLRVADAADSREVIRRPDAAALSYRMAHHPLARRPYRLAPLGRPIFGPLRSTSLASLPSLGMRERSSASLSTLDTRLRSSPSSMRSRTVRERDVVGIPPTRATSPSSSLRLRTVRLPRCVCLRATQQNSNGSGSISPIPCSQAAAAPMATGVRPASSGVPGSRFGTRESQAA